MEAGARGENAMNVMSSNKFRKKKDEKNSVQKSMCADSRQQTRRTCEYKCCWVELLDILLFKDAHDTAELVDSDKQ